LCLTAVIFLNLVATKHYAKRCHTVQFVDVRTDGEAILTRNAFNVCLLYNILLRSYRIINNFIQKDSVEIKKNYFQYYR
jgi:hypothetical protein